MNWHARETYKIMAHIAGHEHSRMTSTKTIAGVFAMGFLSLLLGCSKSPADAVPSLNFAVEEVFYIKPPVDRVILVGTVKQGRITVGDGVTVHCQTGPILVRVEGIETPKGDLRVASEGQQVGLRLTGISKDKPAKGDKVTATETVRISVLTSGEIRIDGEPTSAAALDSRFATLAKAGGEIWYYRESAQGEPHPNAMRVMELVVKHRLPITLSSKPDFSDYIDAIGESHPRQ
jgi:hypothetical protein